MQRIVFFVIASAPKASLRESEAISTVRLDRDCRGHMLWSPKEIDGFCCGRIEIAAVAALLRNDIRGLFSFLCLLRIRSGARNDINISASLCLSVFAAMGQFEKTKTKPAVGRKC